MLNLPASAAKFVPVAAGKFLYGASEERSTNATVSEINT